MNELNNSNALNELRTRPTVSVPVAAELLSVSKGQIYWLIRNGRLPAILVGARRKVIPSIALLAMIEGTPANPESAA